MSGIEIGSVWRNKTHKSWTVKVISVSPSADFMQYETVIGDKVVGTCEVSWFLSHYELSDMINEPPHYKETSKAVQILNEAVAIMAERGKSYDKSGGEAERSMPKIVAMFNALTGHELTPEQGWKFMCCLKLARSEQGEYREDNYLDGAAYMALAGEEASEAADD